MMLRQSHAGGGGAPQFDAAGNLRTHRVCFTHNNCSDLIVASSSPAGVQQIVQQRDASSTKNGVLLSTSSEKTPKATKGELHKKGQDREDQNKTSKIKNSAGTPTTTATSKPLDVAPSKTMRAAENKENLKPTTKKENAKTDFSKFHRVKFTANGGVDQQFVQKNGFYSATPLVSPRGSTTRRNNESKNKTTGARVFGTSGEEKMETTSTKNQMVSRTTVAVPFARLSDSQLQSNRSTNFRKRMSLRHSPASNATTTPTSSSCGVLQQSLSEQGSNIFTPGSRVGVADDVVCKTKNSSACSPEGGQVSVSTTPARSTPAEQARRNLCFTEHAATVKSVEEVRDHNSDTRSCINNNIPAPRATTPVMNSSNKGTTPARSAAAIPLAGVGRTLPRTGSQESVASSTLSSLSTSARSTAGSAISLRSTASTAPSCCGVEKGAPGNTGDYKESAKFLRKVKTAAWDVDVKPTRVASSRTATTAAALPAAGGRASLLR
ncbi:unnamed protein product [Amoebophrya sp. A25]|nr:unnamed protein product [Amoebophrya sp. A25]|eukprot:GSA25T00000178001.1